MKRYLEKNEKRTTESSKPNNETLTKKQKQESQSENLIKLTPLKRKNENQMSNAQKVINFFLDEQSKIEIIQYVFLDCF